MAGAMIVMFFTGYSFKNTPHTINEQSIDVQFYNTLNEIHEGVAKVRTMKTDSFDPASFYDDMTRRLGVALELYSNAKNIRAELVSSCIREVNKSTMVSDAKSDRIKDWIALGR